MTPGAQEIEAKFKVPDEATFQALLDAPLVGRLAADPAIAKLVHDRYLDTPDRAFLRHGFACRVRETGTRRVLYLKALEDVAGSVHRRAELDAELVADAGEAVKTWPDGAAKELALHLGATQPLEPLFELWQQRAIRLLRPKPAAPPAIELSLDRVWFDSPRGTPQLELEAELLPDGDEQQLEAVVVELQTQWRLEPEVLSKFERGLDAAR